MKIEYDIPWSEGILLEETLPLCSSPVFGNEDYGTENEGEW